MAKIQSNDRFGFILYDSYFRHAVPPTCEFQCDFFTPIPHLNPTIPSHLMTPLLRAHAYI